VVLVQNSGWMEPFYSDPASAFKPLVTELVSNVVQPGDALVLAAFNQSLPGAPSPRGAAVRAGRCRTVHAHVQAALSGLETARKPGGQALADTDLGEAVDAALNQVLGGKPGLVWLVTNNRNSPNNDQATSARNREFYALIHRGAAIDKALAFPLRMPVQGAHYSANGLMVYVFAAGKRGRARARRLLASGRVQRVITEPPARLKPLDRDTVRLVPRRVEGAPGVSLAMDAGGACAPTSSRMRWRPAPASSGSWRTRCTRTRSPRQLSARSMLAGENRPIELLAPRGQAAGAGQGRAAGVQHAAAGGEAAR
jgi:hypothetical protein